MTAAKKIDGGSGEPPALRAALELLARGLWPIPIYPPDDPRSDGGKVPIGEQWGATKPTPVSLRARYLANPRAGVGVKLGIDGGVIDVDIDDPARGEDTFVAMMGGENVETMGWRSRRGSHHLFLWDDRLKTYGKSIINSGGKGDDCPGVEVRIGGLEPGGQIQSVVPPSPDEKGNPRAWNGCQVISSLPDSFFLYLDEHVGVPEVRKPRLVASDPQAGKDDQDAASVRLRYALAALEKEVRILESASEGNRNAQLNRSAFALGQLVGARCLDEESVRATLLDSARKIGLGDAESRKTVESGLKDGMAVERDMSGVNGHSGGGFVRSNRSVPWQKVPQDWEPPVARDEIPAVPFPLDVLPEPLADLCRAGAKSMQCPVDYFAATAIGLAGGVMGLSVNLVINSSWHESPNLYMAVVGPPGSKKSPPLRLLAGPLYRIDHDLRERYLLDQEEYEDRKRQYDQLSKRGNGGRPPKVPIPSQLTMDEATVESLALNLSENPRGLALIQDELTAWVAGLNAYRSGRGSDKQFFLKCSSGSLVKVNRKGTRVPIIVPRPCLSITGALTPDTLPAIRDNRNDDGWLDRILFSFPEHARDVPDWTEERIPDGCRSAWNDVVHRLWSRKMIPEDGGRFRPHLVYPTDGAHAEWVGWVNGHRAELRRPGFSKSLSGPWSKMEGFTLRLALILSQLYQAYDPKEPWAFDEVTSSWVNPRNPRDVGEAAMWGAGKLADYFKVHFRRARAELTRRPEDWSEQAHSVLDWIKEEQLKEFDGRSVLRKFRTFDDRDRASAISWLVARRYIRQRPESDSDPDKKGKGGRPHSPTYEVNPYLYHGTERLERTKPPQEEGGRAVTAWLLGYLEGGRQRIGLTLEAGQVAGHSIDDILHAARVLGLRDLVVPDEGTFWETSTMGQKGQNGQNPPAEDRN